MNAWLWAAIALLPALAVGLWVSGRGRLSQRLVGLELATTMSTAILAVLSFAFDQASSIDLALTLALLALPGSLTFALFLERWL